MPSRAVALVRPLPYWWARRGRDPSPCAHPRSELACTTFGLISTPLGSRQGSGDLHAKPECQLRSEHLVYDRSPDCDARGEVRQGHGARLHGELRFDQPPQRDGRTSERRGRIVGSHGTKLNIPPTGSTCVAPKYGRPPTVASHPYIGSSVVARKASLVLGAATSR